MHTPRVILLVAAFALAWTACFTASSRVRADEGMWPLNAFPSAEVGKKFGFAPDQAWLDHVRLGSARLAQGCSGSFVSRDGLIMTNHHCAHDCVQQLSGARRDFVAQGFYASRLDQELRCPALEINQLVAIDDVTQPMAAALAGKT